MVHRTSFLLVLCCMVIINFVMLLNAVSLRAWLEGLILECSYWYIFDGGTVILQQGCSSSLTECSFGMDVHGAMMGAGAHV